MELVKKQIYFLSKLPGIHHEASILTRESLHELRESTNEIINSTTQINAFEQNKNMVDEEINTILKSNTTPPQAIPHNTIIIIRVAIAKLY
jgi:hypothetical protein